MTAHRKILRLDRIQHPVAGQFQLEPNGTIHDVLQPTVSGQQALVAIESDPSAKREIAELHALVRALVPSLTDEEFGKLTDPQITAIVTLASSNIDIVEKLFPNAVSPETDPTSPG